MSKSSNINRTKQPTRLNDDNTILLNEAINNANLSLLQKILRNFHSSDIALLFSDFNFEQKKKFLKVYLAYLPNDFYFKLNYFVKKDLINCLNNKKISEILSKANSTMIVDFLEDLDESNIKNIVKFLPKNLRDEVESLLNYPEDSAGRGMHKNFLYIPKHWNIGTAIKFCHDNKNKIPPNSHIIIVVDHLFKPIGQVSIDQLITNEPNKKVVELMKKIPILFDSKMDQKQVAMYFQKYALIGAPVINEGGKTIGVIFVEDILDVMDEIAEEDILHLGGVKESDIFATFLKTANQRFPWLIINLLTAVIASIVISFFDATIQQVVALAVLMPIIASMGGNAGTQTVTVSVRALATEELNKQNYSKIIIKELSIGFLNGLLFGLISLITIYFLFSNIKLAILFAIAMTITLTIAGLSGIFIPILLQKFNADPAIASSIILTTITDVVAFFVFLGLATYFLI